MNEQSIVKSAPIPCLEKALRVLVAWDSEDHAMEELKDDEAREVFDILQKSETRLNEAIAAAKLDGVADDHRFFTLLSKFGHRISWGAGRNSLQGLIWAGVFNRASETTKEQLLTGLLTDRDFFTTLHALPDFLKRANTAALRLDSWLIQIRRKIGESYSSGFWNGIQTLADHQPECSLEVLKAWTEQRPSDEVTAMSVTCITIRYGTVNPVTREQFSAEVRNFVSKTSEAHAMNEPQLVPFGASVLGCIMHKSPIPPEMWREAFRESGKTANTNKAKRGKKRS